MGELDWHVAQRTGGLGSEFIVHLRRGVPPLPPASLNAARRWLLMQTLLDLHAQTEAVLASEPGLGQPTVRPALVEDAAGQLVTRLAQSFVLAVHHAEYERAALLEPVFGDLPLVCAALNHSDRLHTLYCLALLALFRGDHSLAAPRFACLMAEARHCLTLPEAAALGEEFVTLAAPHCEALADVE